MAATRSFQLNNEISDEEFTRTTKPSPEKDTADGAVNDLAVCTFSRPMSPSILSD